jgi:hypothetical protein
VSPPGRHRSVRQVQGFAIIKNPTYFNPPPRTDVQNLRQLRLVCKAFNHAASRVLFTSACVLWWPGPGGIFGASKTQNSTIMQSIQGETKVVPAMIKNLSIMLLGNCNVFTLSEGKNHENETKEPRRFIENLPQILPWITEIETLQVDTGHWKSSYTGWEGDGFAPSIDIPLLTAFTDSLCNSFRGTSYPRLTNLHLSLPCSYNFVSLSNAMPNAFLQGLKSLSLRITDATGPGGSKEYMSWAEERSDGDENFPSSNLQQQFPNRQHVSGIYDIVSRCTSLDVLGLHCTHHLDGNMILPPTDLKGLYLARIKIHPDNLIKLLTTSIERLWLQEIELLAGTWELVFKHLLSCKSLVYFNPENLTYARGGASFNLRAWNGRICEDTRNLWTVSDEDDVSLERLVMSLVKKAGGRKYYPNRECEQLMLGGDGDNSD